MVRYINIKELTNETFYAEYIEGHRQIWRENNSWTGYWQKPRFANGLLFICPGVSTECKDINGNVFRATGGDIIYIPHESRYVIHFENGGNDPDAYTLNFNLYDNEGNELRLGRNIEIYKGLSNSGLFSISDELSRAFLFSESQLTLQLKLFELFSALSKAFEKETCGNNPIIKKGVSLLRSEWNKNESVSKYAARCGISESSFYSNFRNSMGLTPIEYRNELRINAAKSMLQYSNLTIGEISYEVGFDDPYYFSRIFKKITGISPRAYRNIK